MFIDFMRGISAVSSVSPFTYLVPVVITRYLANMTYNENETAHLNCDATGVPIPTISWSYNKVAIKHDGQKYILANGGRSLTIQRLSYYDIGEYSCTMSNTVNQLNTTGTLMVNG